MFWNNKIASLFLFLCLSPVFILGDNSLSLREGSGNNSDGENPSIYLPLILTSRQWTDCSISRLGAALMSAQQFDDSTGPELVSLAQDGFIGLAGSATYMSALAYFPDLIGWDKTHICNSLECLRTRVDNSLQDGLDYAYLGYGPERLAGVPPEEQNNLPWATAEARQIADAAGVGLMISYSTTQLHQEAEERGFGWNNPGEVVSLLAPFGDIWLIQAADEYNDPYHNPDHPDPILSQRHFPPGPEWRAEVENWVNWIKAANPDIEIWIQLALHRIPAGAPPWEDNYPSAELLLEYREWLVDPAYGSPLVDGVYISSPYSWAIDSVIADQEMEEAIRIACGVDKQPASPARSGVSPSGMSSQGDITLVEEGWTDDLTIPCSPSGECLTILPGYYYRLYENAEYPCGMSGNHQFMVLDNSTDTSSRKHLFAKFLGGAVGFWYLDGDDNRVYYPQEAAVGLLQASLNRNWMFRTSVSQEHANGVTKRFRENNDFRILVPSYCSHDLYYGRGEGEDPGNVDGFERWGYLAGMEAVDYVEQNFNTGKIITYGGSAGAAGSFNIGKDQPTVAGIIMDSQAADLSAISDACYDGKNVFGNAYPCFCPDGGSTCMEVLAPRIGFTLGADEPYRFVPGGLDKPIYYVWNERDASIHAHLQFENLHAAIEEHNPGGKSIAKMVCIDDPNTPPGPICNLHVPSAFDYPDTQSLVEEIYAWALALTNSDTQTITLVLPVVLK